MQRSISFHRLVGLLQTLLLLALVAQTSLGQDFGFASDTFSDWETERIELRDVTSGDASTAAYAIWSSAIGGETDVALHMTQFTANSVATVVASSEDEGLLLQSTADARVQLILSYDGPDSSPLELQASDGLGGINLVADDLFDGFKVVFENNGAEFTGGILVYSAADQSSSCEFSVPVGTVEISCAFDDFVATDTPANFESVQAFVLFLGTDGGADGPVDTRVRYFRLYRTPRLVPPPSGEEVTLYEWAPSRSGTKVPATNWGTAQGGAFNARVFGFFPLPQEALITEFRFDADWMDPADAGRSANANLAILSDDGGKPGEVVRAFENIPIESTVNWFSVRLPEAVSLPSGNVAADRFASKSQAGRSPGHWVRFEVLSEPGNDAFVYGSTEHDTYEAYFEEGGAWGGCTTPSPLSLCLPTGDESFGLSVHGTVVAEALADVGVSVEINDTTFVIGDSIKVTTTVTNNLEVDSPDTRVRINLPSPYLSRIQVSQGSCEVFDLDYIKPISCNLGLLASGDSETIVVSFVAEKEGSPVFDDLSDEYWAMFIPGDFPDVDPDNDSAPIVWNLVNSLVIAKNAPTDRYLAGKEIPFTITVTNRSNETVSGVRIEDVYLSTVLSFNSSGRCTDAAGDVKDVRKVACDIGSLAPGEQQFVHLDFSIVADFANTWPNRASAFSDRGWEDVDEFQYEIINKERKEISISLWADESTSSGIAKRMADPIDVYLNGTRIADDISIGQATPFTTVTLTEYPFVIYLVPGDAPDRSAAFDSTRVELSGLQEGSAIAITADEQGNTKVIVLNDARRAASDANHVDMAVMHAAAGLPLLDVTLMTETEETLIADDFEFGQTSGYTEIEKPGAHNLVVTPDGNPNEAEVFRLDLTTPGEAYMVVIAPGGTSGKLDGVAVYTIDSQGNVVQPAVVTATEEADPTVPTTYALYGNYPNPFNPSTTIAYDLPEAVDVSLAVFDGLGRVVASLVTGPQSLGRHSILWKTEGLPSGIYFVRMEAGDFVETRKMVLLR